MCDWDRWYRNLEKSSVERRFETYLIRDYRETTSSTSNVLFIFNFCSFFQENLPKFNFMEVFQQIVIGNNVKTRILRKIRDQLVTLFCLYSYVSMPAAVAKKNCNQRVLNHLWRIRLSPSTLAPSPTPSLPSVCSTGSLKKRDNLLTGEDGGRGLGRSQIT
jgi:hypothetical protein